MAAFAAINIRLSTASNEIDRVKALSRNHELWSMQLKDIALSSNPLPPVLKKDLTELGFFSMRYSTLAISRSLPVQPLVEINDQMIEGLRMQSSSDVAQMAMSLERGTLVA